MIDQEKKKWEKELAIKGKLLMLRKFAEVVAMMTGVPVQRIAPNRRNQIN